MRAREFIYLCRVEGLPMLSGKLGLVGRERVTAIQEAVALSDGNCELLAFALVEREEQLSLVMEKLKEMEGKQK